MLQLRAPVSRELSRGRSCHAVKAGRPQKLSRVIRAQAEAGEHNAPWKQAAAVLLSTGLALSMAAGPAVAAPKSLEQKRQEQEAALLAQMKKVEYALQQQENARKAELLGKRQVLDNQVEQLEVAIQRKLVEEAANEKAAAAKGEEDRALRIQGEQEQIKATEQALQVAAAKAKAQLDRAEIVEKAKEAEQQQNVQKAASSVLDMLGLTEADLGLTDSNK